MPSGRFGKASLAADTATDLYTVPPGKVATCTINICNISAVEIKVRLAVRVGALAAGDYLEYDTRIPANGVLERSHIVLSPGETVVVSASGVGANVRVYGFEEAL